MSYNTTHPERLEGEVFIMNADEPDYKELDLETKRVGKVSYDSKGKRLSERRITGRPIFAKIEELQRKQPKLLKRLLCF